MHHSLRQRAVFIKRYLFAQAVSRQVSIDCSNSDRLSNLRRIPGEDLETTLSVLRTISIHDSSKCSISFSNLCKTLHISSNYSTKIIGATEELTTQSNVVVAAGFDMFSYVIVHALALTRYRSNLSAQGNKKTGHFCPVSTAV